MKKVFVIIACAGMLFTCMNVQAQEKKKNKFGKFLEKVNKTLDDTNQTLEEINSTLDGTANNTTQNSGVRVTSPTKNLKLEYKGNYTEGHDVVIEFMLTNMTEQSIGLSWGGGTAWDNLGNSYNFGDNSFTIAGKSVSPTGVEVPPEIPVKAIVRLKQVTSKAQSISKITINTYQFKGFEVKKFDIVRNEDNSDNNLQGDNSSSNNNVSILSPTRKLELKYKECYEEGNGTILINFTITNTTSEEIKLNHGGGTAWDDQGESHGLSAVMIGGKEVGPQGLILPAGIPLKGSVQIEGISKEVKEIKLIKIDTYQYKGFEIKNVTITR
ncbi:MAG: hypothetical protein SOX26_04385 [Phocaeicola sp.]|nr:hypothetical protein [Phocaeicola sp.]